MARLSAEDGELAIAEGVLQRLGGEGSAQSTRLPPAETRMAMPRSQREYVLDALRWAEPTWLASAEIVHVVKARWGVKIPERSLRPLLTVMKRNGDIVRDGRLLALPERAMDERRPAASSKRAPR
jgi:hypothetical protein